MFELLVKAAVYKTKFNVITCENKLEIISRINRLKEQNLTYKIKKKTINSLSKAYNGNI